MLVVVLCCVGSQVLKVLEGHTDSIRAVAISADGSKIVSGSRDKTVRVWSMETGEVCLPAWPIDLLIAGWMPAINRRCLLCLFFIERQLNHSKSRPAGHSADAAACECV